MGRGYHRYVDTNFVVSEDADFDVLLIGLANAVRNLRSIDNQPEYARIEWDAPGFGAEVRITQSINSNVNEGTGHAWENPPVNDEFAFETAHRFTPDQLRALGVVGAELKAISFANFVGTEVSYSVKVYTGGSNNPLNPGQLASEQVVQSFVQGWNTIELSNPVIVPSDQELWIAVRSVQTGPNTLPIGTIAESSWRSGLSDIMLSEGQWFSLAAMAGGAITPRSFALRGIVEGAAGRVMIAEDGADTVSNHEQIENTGSLKHYQIWRLPFGQEGNQSSWSLLSDEHNETYILDNEWPHRKGVYRWAVKAVHTGGTVQPDGFVSEPRFTNPLTYQMHHDVSVSVMTSDGGAVTDAVVTLSAVNLLISDVETEFEAIIKSGSHSVVFENVFEGEWRLHIDLEGYSSHTQTFTVVNNTNLNVIINERTFPPRNVVAFDQNTHLILNWEEPGFSEDIWITQTLNTTDIIEHGFGSDNPFIWQAAHRWTPSQLETLGAAGAQLTQVSFVPYTGTGTQYTVNIYTGGNWPTRQPGTLVHSQAVQSYTLGIWNTVLLTNPVDIPENAELWIAIHIDQRQPGIHPMSLFVEETWNQSLNLVINWDWRGWGDLPTWFNVPVPFSWAIRGFVSGANAGSTPAGLFCVDDTNPLEMNTQDMISFKDSSININARGASQRQSEIGTTGSIYGSHFFTEIINSCISNTRKVAGTRSDGSRELEHYRIHRAPFGDLNTNNWVQVADRIQTRQWIDMQWGSVPDGEYMYVVQAVHTNNVVSNPAFSNRVGRGVNSAVTVNVVSADGRSVNGAVVNLRNNTVPEFNYTMIATSNTVVFPFVWYGEYTLTVTLEPYTQYVNNSVIIDKPTVAYATILSGMSVLLTEGFDETLFPKAGWTKINQDGVVRDFDYWDRISQLQTDTTPINPVAGAGMIFSRSYESGEIGFEIDRWLVTPRIDLPSGTRSLELQYFMQGDDSEGGIFLDHLEILVSNTGISTGLAPSTLGPIGEVGGRIGDWTVLSRTQSTGSWRQYSVDLSSFANSAHIYIALRHRDNDRNYLVVDELRLLSGARPDFGIVKGIITDSATGNPLSGAVISVVDSDETATTDDSGAYFLTASAGNVTLAIRRAGYTSIEIEDVDIVAGETITKNISMYLPGSITGIVRNSSNNSTLPNVTVSIAGLQASTNQSGVFTIANIPAGNHVLIASRTGFDEYQRTVTIVAGQQLIVDIDLDIVSDSEIVDLPIYTALQGNYPNPFNPTTTIRFDLANAGNVKIEIFNIRGQRVNSLMNSELEAGRHSVEWNGTDESGRIVSSGVYFYTMQAGEFSSTRRMILMK